MNDTNDTNELQKELYNDCLAKARELESIGKTDGCRDFETGSEQPEAYGSIADWLASQMDIEYTVSSDGTFLGGSVTVCTGGPRIKVCTRSGSAKGRWGGSEASADIDRRASLQLHSAL